MSVLRVDAIQNLGGDSRFGPVSSALVAAAGQTFIEFAIPTYAKRITVCYKGLSTNGASNHLIQIGPVGGVEASGYGGGAYTPATWAVNAAGFLITALANAAYDLTALATLALADAATNTWVLAAAGIATTANTSSTAGGHKALAGALTRVRITTVNGTDTFDAGAVSVMWE